MAPPGSAPPAAPRRRAPISFGRCAAAVRTLLLAAAVAPLALAHGARAADEAPAPRVVNRVAAIVNGEVVTLHELERRAGADLSRGAALPAGKERERAREKALQAAFDVLVAEKLFSAQVKELGVEVTEQEIDGVIAEVKKRNNLDEEALQNALASQGMDQAAYRQAVKRDLESMRLVQLKIRSKLKVTDEDVQNYWQTHPQEFRTDDEVRIRHVFLALSERAAPAEVERVKSLAQDLVRRARAGEDFAELAKKHSEGPSAPDGGDLGWLRRGTVQADVERVAFGLEQGQVSDPLRTPAGYQILRLDERRGGAPRPLAEVKEEIRDRLTNEQGDIYRAQYIADLRKEASIETRIPELSAGSGS